MYIVVEGQDGTGKSTQAKKLTEYFKAQGKKVVHYGEGGTDSDDEFVVEIARLNYGSHQNIDNRTRVLLYLVNRYEQWRKLAEPILKEGGVVVTTRNWFSTLIYEGYCGGVSRSLITKVHKTVMPERYFRPDKTFVLTLDEDKQVERLGVQDDNKWSRKEEFWKSKGGEFQRQLNQGYRNIIRDFDVIEIDANGTIDEVFEKIKSYF